VENLPLAFHPFRNHILIGVGNVLRYYEIGKKKLLKKAENRDFTAGVSNI
jgi:splicing factor 3B subunit 3